MHIGFVAAVFAAGLLSFFSPCILPLLPVYAGYLSSNGTNGKLGGRLIKTLAFVAGLSVTFVLLGFGAGAFGSVVNSSYFGVACGLIIVILGLYQSGLIQIPLLQRERRIQFSAGNKGVPGAFLLGLVFSFSWTPCVGPVLASVLGITSGVGGALTGGLLLFVYSLGLGIPFLVLTWGSHFLMDKVKKLQPHLPKIKVVGGLLIVVMGLWMTFSQVHALEVSARAPQTEATQSAEDGFNFSLQNLEGETISLSDFRNKPVYIKFWGTWCPLCLAGLEDFSTLAQQYNEAGEVQVLSVVAPGGKGEMDAEAFTNWAKGQKLDFPILLDNGAGVNRQLEIAAYPTSVFIDKNGQVVETHVGDLTPEQIQTILETL